MAGMAASLKWTFLYDSKISPVVQVAVAFTLFLINGVALSTAGKVVQMRVGLPDVVDPD